MATHYLSGHTTGPLEPDAAVVESYISEEASIPIWGPVGLNAAGSGEYIARAGPAAGTTDATVIGIAVGPLRDAENGYVSDAAGQAIQVLTFGKGKCRVDGDAANIGVGQSLIPHDADGVACLAAVDVGGSYNQSLLQANLQEMFSVFAVALYASTADLDIIPVRVFGSRGTLT